MATLELSEISVRFGGLQALTDVSFRVEEGDIVGLIGPNGAGKTTVFNVITGVYHTSAGQVSYDGAPLRGLRPHKILALGVARTFQNIRLFQNMTALENVMSFWLCLPVSACFAAVAGCIIGYPTLRMRGDYLAIVTLGFGEIVRIVLNNWMSLTNGPNGILGIKSPGAYWWQGDSLEHIWLSHLEQLYFIILALAVLTIIAVYRLNHSRIGRAFEAVREDQTAAELMGVNTLGIKLLAYALGAVFGGLAGTFFAARMQFVSPESFTFIESAMRPCADWTRPLRPASPTRRPG